MATRHTTVRLSEAGKAQLRRLSAGERQTETIEEALTLLEARRGAYWGGEIGADARRVLSLMALQDAVAGQIEQQEAAERLVGRLILKEQARRI
jgi:hypothetical protein